MVNYFQKMKRKNPGMIIKIDLEKAFDKLEWSYIKTTLEFFYFPTQLKNIIMSCITTSRTVILLNRDRTDFFCPTRGTRQGDPLSPYLFILCMKRLSKSIEERVDRKQLDPITLSWWGPHLFFADDLIIMCKVDKKNCHTTKKPTLKNFVKNWVRISTL